jgi:hypothetical protein
MILGKAPTRGATAFPARPPYDESMPRPRKPETWLDTERATRRDDLLAPRTQVVADPEAYLGQAGHGVGRRITDDEVELFVAGDVAHGLQDEFTLHGAEFIALHDVGTSATLRLLASLAGAAGGRVQRLSIRRQGHGVALAALQFIEVPLADGTPVRVYSTDLNADATLRAQLARVLLAHSRLGVLMVGALPPHALSAQLAPLHEALQRGPWPNRDLLLLPLGSSTALAAQAAQLAADSPVSVHVTPQAAKPRQAWAFIGGAWNRLRSQPGGQHALPTELARAVPKPRQPASEAATEPMPLRPLADLMRELPSLHAPLAPMPMPGQTRWQDYVDRCLAIKGALSGCVFDLHSMLPLAQAGSAPAADRLAQQGTALLSTMADATRALGLGSARPEATVSTPTHHLLLRPVPGHPGVAVHLVLSAAEANLTLARRQLERIEPPR